MRYVHNNVFELISLWFILVLNVISEIAEDTYNIIKGVNRDILSSTCKTDARLHE